MKLYVNGCSHTAAAEAVVPDSFAVDDGKNGIDRRPHPENLKASWCTHVARVLNAELVCDAESASSNARILRTTKYWISQHSQDLDNTLMIIQWTSTEREEWLHDGIWYQVNASGVDWVPDELKTRYKEWIADLDWNTKNAEAHQTIWQFHQELKSLGINHIFYNGMHSFEGIKKTYYWGKNYIHPYSDKESYSGWLPSHGGNYANKESRHFDAQSHQIWAEHILGYIQKNNMLTKS